MKKLFYAAFALMLAFSCAFAEELPVFEWERDGENHWQLDAAGGIVNQGAHEIGEGDWLCAVCGCELLDWGDGTVDVTDYDEYGNILRYTTYADGEKTYESIHVLTCNEYGLVLKDVEYIDGVLYGESVYTMSEEGEQIPVSQTAWNDDGTTSINEYDAYGNCVRSVIFDAEGAVDTETLSEYALSDSGWYYECKTTTSFASGEVFYEETNQYGDPVCTRNTDSDGTAWADWRYEYEYKDEVKVWSKQYTGEMLIAEEFFNEEGTCVREVEYLEDGSKDVTLYQENGDTESITTYAADGSVITVTVYEYIYTEEMDQLELRLYTDGVLTEDTVFHYDEEMCFTGYHETFYHADGTRTVEEYDESMDHLRTVVYAVDGSILSEEEDGADF